MQFITHFQIMRTTRFLRKTQLLKLIDRLPGTVYQYRQWKNGRCSFSYSTRAIEDIFFATPKELAKDGQIAWNRVCPESADLVQQTLERSAEYLEEFEITFRVRSPQDRVHWIRNHAVPERLRDGSTLWHGHMENITVQYKAEEAAKQQAALLTVIFENIPDSIYYKDCKGRFLGANPACCRNHGKTVEEIVRKTDLEITNSEFVKKLSAQEQKLMAEKTVSRERECYSKPDGGTVYLESIKCPLISKSGQVMGLVGISRDITKQVENEEALVRAKQEAEQSSFLISAVFENVPDMLYYKDCDLKIIASNSAFAKGIGASSVKELIGRTVYDFLPEQAAKELSDEEKKLIEKGSGIIHTRKRFKQKDGKIVYCDFIKCPVKNKAGEVIGLVGSSRDVTRQVENEEALVLAKQEAEHSASFIKALFDNLEDQFYYKDRQSRVLGGNKAWVKMRDAESIEDLIGKTDIDLHPAPLGQQLYDNEQRQMANGEVTRIRERHVRRNGQIEYVESVKCPMRDKQGNIIGLAGVSRDITRQVENEKRLIEAQQEAEAANKAKSSFLAMMSHEIRTPMNGVIGAASLLLGTELSEQQQEFVHTIQISGENLLTIINDILDYSKIEAGKIELEKAPFNLRECIENAFDLFAQSAAKKNVELLYYVDPDIPRAFTGDTTRLRQILVNLIGNAIKFTENGEVNLKVHEVLADETRQQCQIQFAVHDTGIGIADEHKDRLFEAFTQADTSSTRKYGGTGLGLTISRRLTELMGGKIWFESEKGKGSTFFFTVVLPVAAEHIDRKTEHLPVEALRGKHALIVDDNETNRWLLSDQLAQWGVISEAFEMPEKALQHLKNSSRYDIALIDFQMPGMDGKELARRIHQMKIRPAFPVIILSSSCEHIPDDPSITARLSKPVKVSKLCTQMLQALAEQKNVSGEKESSGTHIQPKKMRNLRILVAEDNPINQRIAQMMLQRLGCENPVMVSDGEEAVAAVMDAPYDVILMDVQMPHVNGLDATRRIRTYTGKATKPWIIALTAGVMQEEQAEALQAGMNQFLAKPLMIEQLEKTLDHIPLS